MYDAPQSRLEVVSRISQASRQYRSSDNVRMSIVGHGLDLIDCARIARVYSEHGERFLNRILTSAERNRMRQFKDPVSFIAGRFAAKEAILKMIGTGWRGQIAWTDMEILPDSLGRPTVRLSGETARLANELGVDRVVLSITHTRDHAAASAIGLAAGSRQ